MRINSFNDNLKQHNINLNQINFGYWNRTVLKPGCNISRKKIKLKDIQYRNNTKFYREDIQWKNLIQFLINKYEKTKKVNLYNYACSNGSETYTIVMELLEQCGEKNKFFPIIAKDIDKLAIQYAKSAPIPIEEFEKELINRNTNNKFNDYFKELKKEKPIIEQDKLTTQKYYKPQKILTSNIQFNVADILKDYRHINTDNSVVFARNFWPYLKDELKTKLAKKLYNQIGNNSLVILGEYDIHGRLFDNVDLIMQSVGFKKTTIDYVYEKQDNSFYFIRQLKRILNIL